MRAIFHFDGDLTQMRDYFEVESFPDFVEEVRSTWLVEMLRNKSLYSVFQPIVVMPHNGDTPQVFGYECLLRGQHKDSVIMPDTMLQMARGAGLIFQLDLAARRAAILGAGRHGIKEKVFVNILAQLDLRSVALLALDRQRGRGSPVWSAVRSCSRSPNPSGCRR